jgi:hypothetical protein
MMEKFTQKDHLPVNKSSRKKANSEYITVEITEEIM